MKHKQIVKLRVIILGLVLVAIYPIRICISAVKMNNVTKIEYSISGHEIDWKYTEIDFTNKHIHTKKYDYMGNLIDEYTNSVSKEKLAKFKRTCIFCCLPVWRKSYSNRSIMDGDYWETIITYKNGTKKKIQGHEEYPFKYESFVNAVNSVSSK